MKARIWKIVRGLVFVWGCISLIGALVVGSLALYDVLHSGKVKVDLASTHDVRYVLNWSGLGEERIEKVLHSYVSPRSFTGDYLDAYVIQISHVDASELSTTQPEPARHWYRCDQLPEFVDHAVSFVASWRYELPSWFPSEAELRSGQFYVYPWSIYYHGAEPTAAELIFVRPADKMVFFIGSKS